MPSMRWLRNVMLAALACQAVPAGAAERANEVVHLDALVKEHPLPANEMTAAIIANFRAGDNELGILVMSQNRLHTHAQQDHVLVLIRGTGIAELENDAGKVERRRARPGDIFILPRGKKHGFKKSGKQDMVFLVIAGPGGDNPEDTIYHVPKSESGRARK
jgi:mannose-6-phosphate isomerase-like protein (cupin superfamily)